MSPDCPSFSRRLGQRHKNGKNRALGPFIRSLNMYRNSGFESRFRNGDIQRPLMKWHNLESEKGSFTYVSFVNGSDERMIWRKKQKEAKVCEAQCIAAWPR